MREGCTGAASFLCVSGGAGTRVRPGRGAVESSVGRVWFGHGCFSVLVPISMIVSA